MNQEPKTPPPTPTIAPTREEMAFGRKPVGQESFGKPIRSEFPNPSRAHGLWEKLSGSIQSGFGKMVRSEKQYEAGQLKKMEGQAEMIAAKTRSAAKRSKSELQETHQESSAVTQVV